MKSATEIHGLQMMNPRDYGDPDLSSIVPPAAQSVPCVINLGHNKIPQNNDQLAINV